MPCNLQLDISTQSAFVILAGTQKLKNLKKSALTLVQHTDFPDISRVIINLANIQLNISNEETKNLAFYMGKLAVCNKKKCAIVAPKDITFGLSRMFQIFCEMNDVGIELRVFRDTPAALKWANQQNNGT